MKKEEWMWELWQEQQITSIVVHITAEYTRPAPKNDLVWMLNAENKITYLCKT